MGGRRHIREADRPAKILVVLNALLFLFFMRMNATWTPTVRFASSEEFEIENSRWSERGSCLCSIDEDCVCTPSLAIDLILTDKDDKNFVWLVKRKDTGQFGLPGGFVEVDESPEEAALRELKEETNVEVPISKFSLIGINADPARDVRRHSASIVYQVDMPKVKPKAGDDVFDVVRVNIMDENIMQPENFFVDQFTMLQDYKNRKTLKQNGSCILGGLEADVLRSRCCSHF